MSEERDAQANSDAQHKIMARAWEQVNAEELAKTLRAMPVKLRNRLLSRLRTPSSKITPLTARLLVTNLARGGYQDRHHAADVIVGPPTEKLGEIADAAMEIDDLVDQVSELSETWGQSMVVLAAAFGVTTEPARYAVTVLACQAEGWVDDELAGLALELDPGAADRFSDDEADNNAEEDRFSAGGPVADVNRLWEAARAAAARVNEVVTAGGSPTDEDLESLRGFAQGLAAVAEWLEVEPSVSAIADAAKQVDAQMAAAVLARRLTRLLGPEDLSEEIAQVHNAAERLADEPELAARLERFLEVVSATDPAQRYTTGRELRGQPAPPAQGLIDAALAGLLRLVEAGPESSGAEQADLVRALAQSAKARPATGPAIAPSQGSLLAPTDGAPAGTLFAQPTSQAGTVDIKSTGQKPKSHPGDAAQRQDSDSRSAAPAPVPGLGPSIEVSAGKPIEVVPPLPAQVEPDAVTPDAVTPDAGAPAAGSSPADKAGPGTIPSGSERAGPALVRGARVPDISAQGVLAGETPGAPGPSASDGAVRSSVPVSRWAASSGVGPAGAAQASDMSTADLGVGANPQVPDGSPEVLGEGSAPEEDVAATPISPEEAATTLAQLVAARRFSLAYHLAQALGQEYRAAVLAQAALAEGVRGISSPAAAAMVEQALATQAVPSDHASMLLSAASAIRVALLDPSSGAHQVLRALLPALVGHPKLHAFASAVTDASTRGVRIPATGLVADSDRDRAQAEAISSWAEDTLQRPLHAKVYRGAEVWKAWISPSQPLGRVLTLVAANDPRGVKEVRELCEPWADRRAREQAVANADKALRSDRAGNPQPLVGAARSQLLRGAEEVVEQAMAWCTAHASTDARDDLSDKVAARAWALRHSVDQELGHADNDDWQSAATKAAAQSLTATIAMFRNEALPGSELDPGVALNCELTLVNALSFGEDLAPQSKPSLDQVVKASTAARSAALAFRLEQGDFLAAEALIALPAWSSEDFEEAGARQELRAKEREVLSQLEKRWAELSTRFAAARARGRISENDGAELGGRLAQANPRPEGEAPRRDLGGVTAEMDSLEADLELAIAHRAEVLAADIDDAIGSGELSAAWTAKLVELQGNGELGAAEEYLHRARAGDVSPDDEAALSGPDGTIANLLAQNPDGATDAIVELARTGGCSGVLDFSKVDDTTRTSVADALSAWAELGRPEHPANLDVVLSPVLRLLGIIPSSIERPTALRAASTNRYWFIDIHGERSGNAYVPDFGSRAGGRRRFMLCWEDLPVTQLWALAKAHAPADQPVYVLYFGVLSANARVELARHARASSGVGVVVIDDMVVLRCAIAGRQSFDVTMRCVLPYAAPNPYNPDLLAATPVEMFYGRRAEREKVKATTGSSIVSGGRRFGKSALLRSVQYELEGSDVLALLVVIQHVATPPKNDPKELWPLLAARLIEAKVLPAATTGTADAVCGGIRAWLGTNLGKRLLLMLDECDFFLRADANTGFANVVRLRDTMQDGAGRFKVVFSGVQHVARYRRLPNQPLSQLPQPLVIGPLDAASASDLVRKPLQAIGWDITEAQVDRVVTYCACNASVIQLACEHLLQRLYALDPVELAPWSVPDNVLNELLRSPEVTRGVRDRLFLTLELDHRYKLLAYLLAWRATTDGLGVGVPAAELRRMAVEYWPEGFASQRPDDVRALCDELVGLGVFAGDAEGGYRMLSPGIVRVFGDIDEISDELLSAAEGYETDRALGAAGSRMALPELGEKRFSPLTASQLADVVGAGTTQLRVVAGSRALRIDAVGQALVAATQRRLPGTTTIEVTALRQWREAMRAPASGHLVVVSDMTIGRSQASWDESLDAARRRGAQRSERGTRAAVLIAGPSDRWLLRRLVATVDGPLGDLADVAVPLRRVDAFSLQAWDHIEELDIPLPARQQRLLGVTGGWPFLVERALARRGAVGFEAALSELATYLASPEGAKELVAAVGLDVADPDQQADAGLVATFSRLAQSGWRERPADLADLLGLDEELTEEEDPAEAIAVLTLLGALEQSDDDLVGAEPVLASCWRSIIRASAPM